MGLREDLEKRKVVLENDLKPYYSLLRELEDVNKALSVLKPTCNGCAGGCDICRTGPDYR